MINQPANIPNADGYDHDYGRVNWVRMLIGDCTGFCVLPCRRYVTHRSRYSVARANTLLIKLDFWPRLIYVLFHRLGVRHVLILVCR